MNWFAYFSAVESAREKREARYGRLPLWWYPCAAFAAAVPIALLGFIVFA